MLETGRRGAARGAAVGPVIFRESGLRFEADVARGQKTGFFLDQRENRRRVEALAGNRRVLNAFSFSGAFSLYAARGGARAVTDLDLSAHALAGAAAELRAQPIRPRRWRLAPARQIQAEAFDWLGGNAARRFDLVILDPPSLAKRHSERAGALRAYARLAGLGLARLAPGGILVACSCSAHVTAEEFFGAVRTAVARSGRAARGARHHRPPPGPPRGLQGSPVLEGHLSRGPRNPSWSVERRNVVNAQRSTLPHRRW